MKIIKRDGSEVPFDYRKIKNAIEAALQPEPPMSERFMQWLQSHIAMVVIIVVVTAVILFIIALSIMN